MEGPPIHRCGEVTEEGDISRNANQGTTSKCGDKVSGMAFGVNALLHYLITGSIVRHLKTATWLEVQQQSSMVMGVSWLWAWI